jgi:chaperone required for assembly of F1-ATPase
MVKVDKVLHSAAETGYRKRREDMLKLAILVFAIGALGGLYMALHVLRGRLAPWAVSILHAALGATGLVLTALVVLGKTVEVEKIVPIALVILVVAALGGFYLALIHARKQIPARGVVFLHAGLAVVGFLALCGGVFQLI